MRTLILIDTLQTLLDARVGTGATDEFALPSRTVNFGWQTSFNTAPGAISITLQISLDGVVWTTIDTSTNTAGELRTVTAKVAKLVRANVGTNTGDVEVTVTLLCKVANP